MWPSTTRAGRAQCPSTTRRGESTEGRLAQTTPGGARTPSWPGQAASAVAGSVRRGAAVRCRVLLDDEGVAIGNFHALELDVRAHRELAARAVAAAGGLGDSRAGHRLCSRSTARR